MRVRGPLQTGRGREPTRVRGVSPVPSRGAGPERGRARPRRANPRAIRPLRRPPRRGRVADADADARADVRARRHRSRPRKGPRLERVDPGRRRGRRRSDGRRGSGAGPSAVVAQAARVQNLDARGRRRERIVRRETAVLVFRARAVLQGRRVPLLARRGSPGRRGTPGPGRGDGMRRRLALVRRANLFWGGWGRADESAFCVHLSRLVSPRDAHPRGASSTRRAKTSIILFARTRSTAFSRRARPRRRPRAPPRERSRCGR